jgi:cell division protein FtsI (penicillin-binding protein 3)
VLLVGLMIVLAALAVRLYRINTALKPRLSLIADRQHHSQGVLPARRGTIFDVRGRVVALSRQMSDVFVDPMLVEDVDAVAAELAVRVNQPAEHIAETIRAHPGRRFALIARHVDAVTAEAVDAMEHVGVGLVDRPRRSYPLGDSMAHVLGWVGHDGHGMEGIELAWDRHLRGRDGRRTLIRDARRRVLRPSSTEPVPPVDGGHVVLTLDAEIQRMTEDALGRVVAETEAQSAVAVVLSPRDGAVRAMACVPAFDPTDPVTPDNAALRRNRALTDPVEPGSSFKPLLVCGALDGGFVTLTERIDCHGGVHYFGRRRVTDTSPRDLLDLRGVITFSSNIGMATIAERMGNEALWETIRRFGMGERTGIGLPGESGGVVYPLHRWTSYSAVSIAMGYEVLVTPLQLANAFAAIINDGVLLRPRIVEALLGPDGQVVESFSGPQMVRRVASSGVAGFVSRDLLASVVEHGTGKRIRGGPYRILGKTGTAKLAYTDRRGYEPDAYLTTFVGAAPADHPDLVALVMVRRPAVRPVSGGAVSGPVVRDILTQCLAYLEVPAWTHTAQAGL